MKKILFYGFIIIAIGALIYVANYFAKSNRAESEVFETEKPFTTSIERETVAAGKVIPENEVEIKPQISGIIEKIYLEEGQKVKTGDLIAKVKVVPNEQSLNSAKNRVKNANIVLNNNKVNFERNKALFDKGVISRQEYERSSLSFDQSKQEVSNALSDMQIIKKGSSGGASSANTNIRATVSGTILEIPVKEGDQVIESNTFNAGTSIATIADLSKMIFEGKVDEAEVGKLKPDTDLKVKLGAIENKDFNAKLTFIAPKGQEESGAVQFKIKADVTLDDTYFIRAGYSANASIKLEMKEDVLAINESLLQYNRFTDKPYVEIKTGDNEFKKVNVELGISDGLKVEILKGVKEEDEIKIWNKKAAKKLEEKEASNEENEDNDEE